MVGVYVYFAADGVPSYVFINNTNRSLTLNFMVDSRAYTVASAQAVTVPPLSDWSFTIDEGDGKQSRYKLAPVDRSHVSKNTIYFQIQQDRSVYLVISPSETPIQNLPLQSEGYPLRPQ
jgi:hypothetical protein